MMWIFVIATIVLVVLWIKNVKTYPVFKGSENLHGKTVIVTGANSGIGKATALELANRNARVIMACRNKERAMLAVKEIREQSGNRDVHFIQLDLADFESIKKFVAEYNMTETSLHILVNNAGVVERGKTVQGFDKMFGTNHLGPFLLTTSLMSIMKTTSKYHPVRIVNVSADLHKISKIQFDRLDPDLLESASFLSLWKQYAHTKLMNVHFTSTLAKKLSSYNEQSEHSITTYSLHPGVLHTGLAGTLADSWYKRMLVNISMFLIGTSYYYGSQTSLYCCLEEGIESKSGGYFKKCKYEEVFKVATEQDVGEKLWRISSELCNLPENF